MLVAAISAKRILERDAEMAAVWLVPWMLAAMLRSVWLVIVPVWLDASTCAAKCRCKEAVEVVEAAAMPAVKKKVPWTWGLTEGVMLCAATPACRCLETVAETSGVWLADCMDALRRERTVDETTDTADCA